MPTARVNESMIYYEELGHGPALLFIHGMCGNANVWDDQVARLSPQFRCITYDRRGHTRSPLGSIRERTVELHADDAAALVTHLQLAPCLLVASSGGARIGVDLLRRYPALFVAAALSEPPLFALDPEGAKAFVSELQPNLERAMAEGGPRAAVDAFFEYVCPGLWNEIDEGKKEAYRANHEELFGDLRMPPYQISVADLRAIETPCRLITGERSHRAFRHIARTVAEQMPNAKLVEIADAGHVTYAEQPERFADVVKATAAEIGFQ
jgi:3-oxoadipate enol-lactonase